MSAFEIVMTVFTGIIVIIEIVKLIVDKKNNRP